MVITDCVRRSTSPWFFGDFGFVLTDAQSFNHLRPCRGALGFFDVPDNIGLGKHASGCQHTKNPGSPYTYCTCGLEVNR